MCPGPPPPTLCDHCGALACTGDSRSRARVGRAAGGQVGRGAKRRSIPGAGVVFMIPKDRLVLSIGSVSHDDDLHPAPPCCLPVYLPYLPRPRRAAGASVRPEPRSRTCRAGVWYPPPSPRARAAPGSIPGGAPRRRRPWTASASGPHPGRCEHTGPLFVPRTSPRLAVAVPARPAAAAAAATAAAAAAAAASPRAGLAPVPPGWTDRACDAGAAARVRAIATRRRPRRSRITTAPAARLDRLRRSRRRHRRRCRRRRRAADDVGAEDERTDDADDAVDHVMRAVEPPRARRALLGRRRRSRRSAAPLAPPAPPVPTMSTVARDRAALDRLARRGCAAPVPASRLGVGGRVERRAHACDGAHAAPCARHAPCRCPLAARQPSAACSPLACAPRAPRRCWRKKIAPVPTPYTTIHHHVGPMLMHTRFPRLFQN